MHNVLLATSHTLSTFLTQAMRATPGGLGTMFASGGSMEVTLNTPEEMTGSQEGLSVWLYRLMRDDQRLNAPPRRTRQDESHRSLPFCLYYLMTPVVALDTPESPETEQLILGRVLQALHDQSTFRGSDLSDHFEDPSEIVVRVRFDPMGLEEITRVWDALDRSYQLSICYEVSVAYVESARPVRSLHRVEQVLASNAGPGGGVGIEVAEGEAGP